MEQDTAYHKAARDYNYKLPGYERSEKQTIVQVLEANGKRRDVLIVRHKPIATVRNRVGAIIHDQSVKYAGVTEAFLQHMGGVEVEGLKGFDYTPYRLKETCPWLTELEDNQRSRKSREREAGGRTPALIRQFFFSGIERACKRFISVEFLNRCCVYVSRSGMVGAAAVWDGLTDIMKRYALFMDDAGLWRVSKQFRNGMPFEVTMPRARVQDFIPLPYQAIQELLEWCKKELPEAPGEMQGFPSITRKGQRVRAFDGTLILTLHPSKYESEVLKALAETFNRLRGQQVDADLLA